jgi:hypothetical protein
MAGAAPRRTSIMLTRPTARHWPTNVPINFSNIPEAASRDVLAFLVGTFGNVPLGHTRPSRLKKIDAPERDMAATCGGGLINQPDRLQSKTEIASCDLAMCLDLCGDARDRRGWDDENPAPRAEHRHAEGLTGRIESKAAFGVPPERQVELDPRVDLSAAHRLPGDA